MTTATNAVQIQAKSSSAASSFDNLMVSSMSLQRSGPAPAQPRRSANKPASNYEYYGFIHSKNNFLCNPILCNHFPEMVARLTGRCISGVLANIQGCGSNSKKKQRFD